MSDPPELKSPEPPGQRALPTISSIARGGAWTTAGRLLPQVYSTVISIAAARALGADGFGRLTFIVFIATTLTTLLTLGLPTAVMRHVAVTAGAGSEAQVATLVAWAWRIEIVGAALGLGVLVVVSAAGADPGAAWALAGVVCASAVLHSVPSALLLGLQRFREASIVGLVTGAVAVGAKVAVLALGGELVALMAVDAVIGCANLLGTQLFARRIMRTAVGPGVPAPALLRQSRDFALIASLGIVINYIVFRKTELLFLDRWSTDADIAVFSIAFSFVAIALLLPQALGVVVASTVATYHGAEEVERIRAGYGRSLRLAASLALPVTGLAIAVGPSLLVFLYGAEFAAAGRPLRILLATLPLLPMMTIAQALLLGLGRQWVPLAIGTVAAVAGLGLDVVLIPLYDAVGAAIANTTAQLLVTAPLLVYADRVVGGVRIGGTTLVSGLAVAVAATIPSALVASRLDPLPAVALGTVVFAAALAALTRMVRVLDPDDGRWLDQLVGSRLGGSVGWVARSLSHSGRATGTAGS